MAFDAKAFAIWNVKFRVRVREMLRRLESHKALPNLGPVWAVALSELANLTKKVAEGMLARLPEAEIHRIIKGGGKETLDPKTVLSLSLIRRLQAFPQSLHYQIISDGTVLIYSDDRYLEGALYFGTRQLPQLRPIEFLVSRMTLRLADLSLVFIARDFRKPHETHEDFKRENLRQVTTDYA